MVSAALLSILSVFSVSVVTLAVDHPEEYVNTLGKIGQLSSSN